MKKCNLTITPSLGSGLDNETSVLSILRHILMRLKEDHVTTEHCFQAVAHACQPHSTDTGWAPLSDLCFHSSKNVCGRQMKNSNLFLLLSYGLKNIPDNYKIAYTPQKPRLP